MTDLPSWDLSDLYNGLDDKNLTADINKCKEDSNYLLATYQYKINTLSAEQLLEAIQLFDLFICRYHKVNTYIYLLEAEDGLNQDAVAGCNKISDQMTDIINNTNFFRLEIIKLPNKILNDQCLAHYQSWLDGLQRFSKHYLDSNLQCLMNDKDNVANYGWIRLFDHVQAKFVVDINDKQYNITEAMNLLSDIDSNKRSVAAKAINKELSDKIDISTNIYNNIIQNCYVNNKWYKYKSSLSAVNKYNDIEDNTINFMHDILQKAYPDIVHKYYLINAKHLNVEQLNYWDRSAPLNAHEDKYTWNQAKEIVIESYYNLSTEIGDLAKLFFDNNWIDTPIKHGKASGAFCHPASPDTHPYILMNFNDGDNEDVMTLAHEVGHGIHQLMTSKHGALMGYVDSTNLAETASIFGEMLVFDKLVKNSKNPKPLYMKQLGSTISSIFRQVSFHEFELQAHKLKQEKGLLSSDDLNNMWLEINYNMLGPAFKYNREYGVYWSYIPHFIHSPFYVHSYAFSGCLVNNIYKLYLDNADNFKDNYKYFLSQSSVLRSEDLFKIFNFNVNEKKFWDDSLLILKDMLVKIS